MPADVRDGESVRKKSSLREAQKQFTHSRLLSAAEAEFSRKGYSSTTVDDIVTLAGATRATFYLHFGSKAEVVVELLESIEAIYHPLWDMLRELPVRPTRQAVRSWLVTAARTWEVNGQRATVVVEAFHAEPELLSVRREREATDLALLTDAVAHLGWSDETHARLECMLLLAQLSRAFDYWHVDPCRLDERLLDVLAWNWWAAFERAADAREDWDVLPSGPPGLAVAAPDHNAEASSSPTG